MTTLTASAAPASTNAKIDPAYRAAAQEIATTALNAWSEADDLVNRLAELAIENPGLDTSLEEYAEAREADLRQRLVDALVLAGEPIEHDGVRYWARYDAIEDTFVLALEYL